MNDDTLSNLYGRHLAARQVDRDRCPSVESLEALVNRTGAEADRLNTLDHVMSCPACRHDFDLMMAAAEAARASAPPRSRVPLAIAAGLLLVAAGTALWTLNRDHGDTVRGGPTAVTLLRPTDGVSVLNNVSLVWQGVAGAFQYHVEILHEDGRLRFQETTTDTVLVVPPAELIEGQSYVWWVRADLAAAGERRSALRRFTIRKP
jgi:hypothetical protein